MLSSWDITMEDTYAPDDVAYEANVGIQTQYAGIGGNRYSDFKNKRIDPFMKRHGAVVAAGAGLAGAHALKYGVSKAYKYFKNRNNAAPVPAPTANPNSSYGYGYGGYGY